MNSFSYLSGLLAIALLSNSTPAFSQTTNCSQITMNEGLLGPPPHRTPMVSCVTEGHNPDPRMLVSYGCAGRSQYEEQAMVFRMQMTASQQIAFAPAATLALACDWASDDRLKIRLNLLHAQVTQLVIEKRKLKPTGEPASGWQRVISLDHEQDAGYVVPDQAPHEWRTRIRRAESDSLKNIMEAIVSRGVK